MRPTNVIVYKRKGEDDESFIKRFSRKVFKSGIRREIFDKRFALTKSEKRRRKNKSARFRR